MTDYLDNGCTVDVLKRVKQASERFLNMKNNNGKKEKVYFPKLNLWNRANDSEEIKFKKATNYLCDQLIPSVPHEKQRLEFKLIEFLFFNKT